MLPPTIFTTPLQTSKKKTKTLETKLITSKLSRVKFSQTNSSKCTLLFQTITAETSRQKPSAFHSAANAWRFTKGWGNNRKSEIVVSVSGLHYSHLCTLIGFPFAGCILPPTHSTHQRQPAQIGTVTTITAALCFPF